MSIIAEHIGDVCKKAEQLADSGTLKGEIASLLRRKAKVCRGERCQDVQNSLCSELEILTEQFAKGGLTEAEVDRRISESIKKVTLWDMAWMGAVAIAVGMSMCSLKRAKCNAKELSVLRGH